MGRWMIKQTEQNVYSRISAVCIYVLTMYFLQLFYIIKSLHKKMLGSRQSPKDGVSCNVHFSLASGGSLMNKFLAHSVILHVLNIAANVK